MFKLIDFNVDKQLSNEVIDMLKNDSRSPFDYLREPLASLLGLVTHPAVGCELGVLTDDEGLSSGYCVFSQKEILQFYISPDQRDKKLGREMLNKVKEIFKGRGLTTIHINILHTEQAQRFWEGNGAYCENANARYYLMEL